MKKLTLNPDALKVESFAAVETSREAVVGAEFMTGPANCVTISCGDSEIRACFFG
jgi:hypothetical protein